MESSGTYGKSKNYMTEKTNATLHRTDESTFPDKDSSLKWYMALLGLGLNVEVIVIVMTIRTDKVQVQRSSKVYNFSTLH